jgi:hypothetical protein
MLFDVWVIVAVAIEVLLLFIIDYEPLVLLVLLAFVPSDGD